MDLKPQKEPKSVGLSQKKEIAFRTFAIILDRKTSYQKARMTPEEIEEAETDQDFVARMDGALVDAKISVVKELKDLMAMAQSDSVRLQAIKEFGRIAYPASFVEGYDESTDTKNLGTVKVEGAMTHTHGTVTDTAEIFRILQETGGIQSPASDDTSAEADEIHHS